MPHQPTKADKQTLIEQGTEFKGTMKSSCPVVVNGRVEGELSAPELDVTVTGTVRGNIKADRLSSRGTLSGNIDAGDSVPVRYGRQQDGHQGQEHRGQAHARPGPHGAHDRRVYARHR